MPERGWVNAGDLRVGDVLVTLDGFSLIIERIYREHLETPETTYNFEVEDFHTYYVSDAEFLVHNECKPKSRIKENNSLAREASKLEGRVQQEVNDLVKSFVNGNTNPGLGSKYLSGDIYYLRGRNGGRVFYRMVGNTMEILGKATKANESKVIAAVLQSFS